MSKSQIDAYNKVEEKTGRKFKLVTLGDYSEKSIEAMAQLNLIYTTSTGSRYKKYYLDEAHDTVGSIWTDIKISTATKAKESIGYNTQKPRELIQKWLG